MARLTWADVRGGKAIPQPGDIVGDLQYRGGDPSDLSRCQPLDGRAPRSGSVYDPDAFTASASSDSVPDGHGGGSGQELLDPSYLQSLRDQVRASTRNLDSSLFHPTAYSILRTQGFSDDDLNLRSRHEHYAVPNPGMLPSTTYMPDQLQLAIARAQDFPHRGASEWATNYRNENWSDWAKGSALASKIDPKADINMHYHADEWTNPTETEANYFPGPADHMVPVITGKPEFILTPDTNTLLFVGIENGKYVLRPVWQRPGTTNPRGAQYEKWHPTGHDSGD